jgi:hypothetical protein
MGGFGNSGIPFPQEAQGLWPFDDCNPDRTELFDALNQNHTAFRSVSTACTIGRQQQGITIDGADDFVYVPDQPSFKFAAGVTVAAWVKPTKLSDVRSIFRKREGGTSSFVLAENGKDYQFVIRLNDGRTAAVSAKATLDVWTHVAATYDGAELVLYLDGVRAAYKRIVGQLSEGAGPLLLGNDAYGRRIDGSLDNVFFDIVAATPEQIASFTCIAGNSSVVAVPAAGPHVSPGTQVDYDIEVTNHDSPTCAPKAYQFSAFPSVSDLRVTPQFAFTAPVAPEQSAHVVLSVTSSPSIDPDTFSIPFSFFAQSADFRSFDEATGTVTYSVDGGPCSIRTSQELMIRDVSVVEDVARTAPGGAWTFGKLMTDAAPSTEAAPDMVESVLKTWLTAQTVNSFVIPARPAMQDLVLSSFPRTADGKLDLTKAPLRLLAIVNRLDLRDLANHNAGEGRFVFGVLDPSGNQTQFTMIFEFKLPAETEADVLAWSNRWHALGAMPFPSAQYNVALQAITDRFAGRGVQPAGVNGSALSQFRTNEIALSSIWQFREFHLSPASGNLVPAGVALTPDLSFNLTQTLGDFINANEADILAERHTVPETFNEVPFLTGSVTNDLNGWDPAGVNNPEARHKFSVNTCNGCHSLRETNTPFLQVNPRGPGQVAFLSGFLTGTTVFDRRNGTTRSFNDLRRRSRDLHALICPDDPLPPDPATGSGGSRGGIGGQSGMGTAGAGGGTNPGPDGSGGSTSRGGTGGTAGTPPPIPVPGVAAATHTIDESVADTRRPDFISKGIGRVH